MTKNFDIKIEEIKKGEYDDVATGDIIRIDVDTLSTTKPKGLVITLAFRLP